MLKLASLLQHEMLADVADGSIPAEIRCLRYVRSAPNNGLMSDIAASRFGAINGHLLFEHNVSAHQEPLWDHKANGLRGLEIDG